MGEGDRIAWWIVAGLGLLSAAELVVFFGSYTGDGLIHLIFAENALAGHLLQFNPGEYTGGETSMGFMFAVIPLVAVLGKAMTLVVIKIVSIGALLGIGWLVFALSRDLGAARGVAAIAAAASLCMPGTILNGQSGSENVFFALGVLLWLRAARAHGWLDASAGGGRVDAALGGVAGALAWIRPEAIPLFALAAGYRLLIAGSGRRAVALGRTLAFGVPFALGVLLYAGLYYGVTGLIPFSAGSARTELSKTLLSFEVFGYRYGYFTLLRSLFYLPLVGLSVLAGVDHLRASVRGEVARYGILLLAIFAMFMLLYGSVLPTIHTARYTMFLWPLLFVVVATWYSELGDAWIESPLRVPRVALGSVALLAFVLIVSVEFQLRQVQRNQQFFEFLGNVEQSQADSILEGLGSPEKRPINVAVVEVQLRNYLDERFVVRSLDGIVDGELVPFYCGDYVDHIGYLLEREIDYVGDLVNLNGDKTLWSLDRIYQLAVGEQMRRGGVTLTRLGRFTRVEVDREHYARRPHRRCDRSLYVD